MSKHFDDRTEWLEADGLGGFASGTASTIRTRRYHALLLSATRPPGGRMVLVNGAEVRLETPEGEFALSSELYGPGIVHPDGATRIDAFEPKPHPRWWFGLPDGTRVEHGLMVVPGRAATLLYWKLVAGTGGRLHVLPFISGRDYHSLHHENAGFNFRTERAGGRVTVCPYQGVPAIIFDSNGEFVEQADWYRNFQYQEESNRGLDCTEDLATVGVFTWDLARGEAFMAISGEGHESRESMAAIRDAELKRRTTLGSSLVAADSYIVCRGAGSTIIAGYPWFTDWGRDTFISMRGLCLATGRLDKAREILLQWAWSVSEGMLPNRFPDAGIEPEFNSVDASLWYVIAVHDFLSAAGQVSTADRRVLQGAVDAILNGYSEGTRFGIKMDSDGLLVAGQPGVQLTWMDAKVGDWVVTPRIGKPVEVQALWLNALKIGASFSERWATPLNKGMGAFASKFFDSERGCLYDVVDTDHKPGATDRAMRPNQIFAVGGLPYQILHGERARSVVDTVEARLLTPAGLRSLDPNDSAYRPRYQGDVRDRDAAYHQGTVWPWLMGPFVDAWLKVRGATRAVKEEARSRFLKPMIALLDPLGTGHLPEIADGDPPHTARGCPFQAWSVGEVIRISKMLE